MIKNRTTNNKRGAAGGVLIGICLISGLGCDSSEAARAGILNQGPTARPVEVATAKAAPRATRTEISGTLAAYRDAALSADVAETIIRWPWLEGDRVAEGQVLCVQDDRAVRAQVSELTAQSAQARAEVERLRAEYDRAALETSAGIASARSGLQAAQANADKVDSITRTQEMRQAETRLAQAKADEDLARKELDRFTNLVQGGAASQQTLDQVRAKFDVATQARISADQGVSLAREGARVEDRSSAAAGVSQARATLDAARSRPSRLAAIRSGIDAAKAQADAADAALRRVKILLAKHVKTAPFSGRILSTQAELGMTVAPGTPLLTLGETSRLKLRFSVPEELRSSFAGDTVSFTIPSLPGRTFSAPVRSRGVQADLRTRTFAYEAIVPNGDERLLPGMVARVALSTPFSKHGVSEGVSVPLGALVMDGTSATVFTLSRSSSGDRVQIRRVLVVRRDGESAVVGEGLRPGDRVVLSPKNLADGDPVKVANP